jgi:hypothetical protein
MSENFPSEERNKIVEMVRFCDLLLDVYAGLGTSYYYSEDELIHRKECIKMLQEWWQKNDMHWVFGELKDLIQENEIPLINHDIVM